jgi:NitT/TauT family transport system permease protein
MRRLPPILLVLAFWTLMSWIAGSALVPTPWETVQEMVALLGQGQSWRHILITFFRGTAGLSLAGALALLIGIPCGLSRRAMDILSPVVFAIQACPAIIWIALLMVWVGIGSLVPVAAIAVSTFPALFLNVAQGVASLDRRLFVMAGVYRVSPRRILRRIILPGISSHALAGFSYALGVCWKVTATAEFIGSASGVGAQIYWAYRFLDMPRLFCWAIILIGFGVLLEIRLIQPLRRRVANERMSGGD